MIESYEQIRKTAKSIKPLRFKVIASVITILLVVIVFNVITFVFFGVKAAVGVSNTIEKAENLLHDINNKDWQGGVNTIGEIEDNLIGINKDMGRLGLFAHLPKIKNDVYVTRQFLIVAEDLAGSYQETFKLFEEVEISGIDLDLYKLLENKEALDLISKNKEQFLRKMNVIIKKQMST